ncbi:MAG: response regulator [Geobacter sp.]|nr:response regulator [Geobacter sp.]
MQKTVLVIEDELVQREMMSHVLTMAGYRVLVAEDGMVGYEIALAERPDLIILDVIMPEVDGFEVCSHFRADAEMSATPIVLLTSLADDESILDGFRSGADGFITKPWVHQELLNQVRIQLCKAIVDQEKKDPAEYPFNQSIKII